MGRSTGGEGGFAAKFFPMELEVLSDLEREDASPAGITERLHDEIDDDFADIFRQGGRCSHGMASDDGGSIALPHTVLSGYD